ncbi:MAG: helix-turn-helix domain-containing protein [Thermoplasmata archaeon]|nr:helix-turn-helix domain-containing protein [Thermoplasmata archaeon]
MAPLRTSAGRPAPTLRASKRPQEPTVRGSFVEVHLRPPPTSHWMRKVSERFGAHVRLMLCRPTGPGETRMLRVVEISSDPEKMPEILRFVRKATPRGLTTVASQAPHRAVVWAEEPMDPSCAAVYHVGAVCNSCPLAPTTDPSVGPEGEWRLIIPKVSPRARALLKVFRPEDGSSSLLRVGGPATGTELTTRQERAVDAAFQMGYFDHPRRVGLREVAKALGVSRSTALELIRRGLTKVLARRSSQGFPGFSLE